MVFPTFFNLSLNLAIRSSPQSAPSLVFADCIELLHLEVARIHRKTVKKDLQDADNHDGVITHLELDILEFEDKWALGSIATNKAIGGDGIPAKLFQ